MWDTIVQTLILGLTLGFLYALIAIGYTMVYGIIGLINFAHGDVFMLGSILALTLVGLVDRMSPGLGFEVRGAASGIVALCLCLLLVPPFCAGINVLIDRWVYRPLRNAPKLAPLVSAIGVSFILMNIGQIWNGVAERDFPMLVPRYNLFEAIGLPQYQFLVRDLVVVMIPAPLMLALTLFVKHSKLGKAMRATEQNPVAARLMGIDVDRVIAYAFAIGGALAGAASVVFGMYVNTVGYQIGFQNGMFAFTAAVLGGIGRIPGAVLGGLLIGLIRAFSTTYLGEKWTTVVVFALLILVLVFRPSGILGTNVREKV